METCLFGQAFGDCRFEPAPTSNLASNSLSLQDPGVGREVRS